MQKQQLKCDRKNRPHVHQEQKNKLFRITLKGNCAKTRRENFQMQMNPFEKGKAYYVLGWEYSTL